MLVPISRDDGPGFAQPLRGHVAPRLVGREQALDTVTSFVARAIAGSRELVFVVGEPGIGKTAFAAQVGLDAFERGCNVLYGGCEIDGVVPYQPFVEALDGLIEALAVLSQSGRAQPGAHLSARYRFFEMAVGLLTDAARDAPAVLVLDDLHWADDASIRLLQYIARESRLRRLLILATYRPTDVERDHVLRAALGELRVDPGFTRVELGGISPDAVAELVHRNLTALDDKQRVSLASSVHEETGGNPLFVVELLRHIATEGATSTGGDETAIPQRITELVEQRLARVRDEAVDVLRDASALGRSFRLEVLQALTQTGIDQLLDVLDEAVARGFLIEPLDATDSYSFSHALVRDALYQGLSGPRRVRLHDRVVTALEAMPGGPDKYLRELAHHSRLAAPLGDITRAVHYAQAAGDHALAHLAFEEAATLYRHALELGREAGSPADERTVRLWLGVADALAGAGANQRAIAACEEALALAKELGLPELQGRAAVRYEQASYAAFGFMTDPQDRQAVDVLEDALAALEGRDDVTRALVLNHLPRQLSFTMPPEARLRYAEAGLALADSLGDEGVRAAALEGLSWALLGPDDLERRLAVGADLVRSATVANDLALQFWGHSWRCETLMERGDGDALDAELAALDEVGRQLRAPFFLWWTAINVAMRAMLDQPIEHAEKLALDAYQIGAPMETVLAEQMLGVQYTYVRYHADRLQELVEMSRDLTTRYASIPAYDSGLTWMLAETGQLDEARDRFERHAAPGFESIPRISTWMVTLAHLSDTCCALGDRTRAGMLYELLLPYEDNVVSGAIGVVCAGPVARYLAELATVLQRWDDAERHFAVATECNTRLRAPSWDAHTKGGYAAMLRARDRRGDADRATALAAECASIARDLGTARAARRASDDVATG